MPPAIQMKKVNFEERYKYVCVSSCYLYALPSCAYIYRDHYGSLSILGEELLRMCFPMLYHIPQRQLPPIRIRKWIHCDRLELKVAFSLRCLTGILWSCMPSLTPNGAGVSKKDDDSRSTSYNHHFGCHKSKTKQRLIDYTVISHA